ncbi:MAG: hypothetical protein KA799_02165 [Bacteroidales bacterium]|nr:hypothetical protein [Bacteroidales bacterium]
MDVDIDKRKYFNRLNKFITWIILLFMPLSTYTIYTDKITYGDVLIFIGFLMIIINVIKNNLNLSKIISSPLLLYGIFIIIHSLIFWMLKPYELSKGLFGVLRYLLYLFMPIIGARYFFNYQYAYKIYKKLAIVFALYCIAQFVSFKCFSVVLPSNLFGLPTVDYVSQITSEYNVSMYLSGNVMYRPRSLFLEPSYFAKYQIPILYLILNNTNEKFSHKYGVGLLITLSIFLAGTTTGIILLVFCWWKPIITELKKLSLKFAAFLMIMIPGSIYAFNSDYMQSVLRRIISSDGSLGSSVVGRINNYPAVFQSSLTWHQFLFGNGMWTDVGYLPSWGSIIVSFGLIGLMVFLGMLLRTYCKIQKRGRAMILLLLIMCIGTNTLFNISSVLMFFLIYSGYENIEKNR